LATPEFLFLRLTYLLLHDPEFRSRVRQHHLYEVGRRIRLKQDIDLLFFGTAHGDRYPVLKSLSDALASNIRFEIVLYLPSQAIYAVRRVLDPRLWSARRSEFIFSPLSKGDIQSLVARARAVVDIERSVQAGLTMRSVEALGAGRKLVTTNRRVLDADFFNPNNVAVIDRRSPELPARFLERPYAPPRPDILHRYSLSGWVQEVLVE